ncbi:MAG: RdgB/HAM1 family non-canonical purine NTP pyrophosphatase [Synechococcales cyanobacterium]
MPSAIASHPMPLVLASRNPGKLREFQALWDGIPHWTLTLLPEGEELPETGTTFKANAIEKAQTAARWLGQWALADDSGLCVEVLGGAPGVYSSRYGRTDQERIERLLQELGDMEHRAAYFAAVIAVCDPTGTVRAVAEGICQGEISRIPKGQDGFGYNPIFYVPESGLTFAEMSAAQKHQLSHRGRAWRVLKPQLLALP